MEALGKLTTTGLIRRIDDSHVTMYPSKEEGFGLPPYESLLRGVPVVLRRLPPYLDYLKSFSEVGVVAMADGVGLTELVCRALSGADPDALSHRGALKIQHRTVATDLMREQITAWLGTRLLGVPDS